MAPRAVSICRAPSCPGSTYAVARAKVPFHMAASAHRAA
jgi:hypothetical protein